MNTRSLLPSCLLTVGLLACAAAAHAQQAPANDNYANRQSIPSQTSVTVTGTTVGATQEPFEITNAGSSDPGAGINETKTVWYDYVPPVSGYLDLTLPQTMSGGQTYALLFQGATPDLAHLIDEGYLPGNHEYLPPSFVHVVAGQEYTISLGNTELSGQFHPRSDAHRRPSIFHR